MKNKYFLLISVILISLIGVIMIYSSSVVWAEYKFNDPYKFLKSQSLFLIIGLILMYFVSRIDYNFYYKHSNKLFLFITFLLIIILIPGIGTVRNGSRSWFGIAGLGIQPSEFMKLAMIIFISKYITNNEKKLKDIKKGVLPILFTILIIFGLIMLQPDLGTGLVLVMISISMLFTFGVNLNFFLKLGIIGIAGIVVLILIAPYRLKRIESFLNPWKDPLGSGFQIIMSLYAIGPGKPL